MGSYRKTTSHYPPTLSITTPSPPSQTYIPPPPLHLTLMGRETFFLTKSCCRLIFKPSFLLLLISYTLFTFPSASCWTFICNFTGFLAIFNVVTLTTTTTSLKVKITNFLQCRTVCVKDAVLRLSVVTHF